MWVPDNYDAYKRHEAKQHRERAKLPICYNCMEPITDDELFDINDTIICKSCMMDDYLKPTSNYINEPDDWDGSEDDLPW